MEMIWYLIQLSLVLFVLELVIGPIVIYFTNKQSANPQFTTFDLSNPPMKLPASYMQSLPVLESLGFTPVAHLFAGKLATTIRMVLTVYVNRIEKETAVVVHMLSEVPPITRLLLTYTEFCTEFEDGYEVNTINAKQPSLFAVVPEKQIFRLPHLEDPRQLYKSHQVLAGQHLGTNKRLAPPGTEVEELIDGMKRDLAREAIFGRMALDAAGEWYRPTMRGAIHGTLMLIWPIGMVRRMLQRRRGVQLAAEVFAGRYHVYN